MRTLKERIKNFKMPHTYVILVTIMFIVLILTHIIPAGSYERVEDAVTGKMVVVPDSYAYVDAEAPGLFGLFQALYMANAGGAWDNAKKVVEVDLHEKGSALHAAAVVGDTVGDPYKDTSSVALNPIIKFTTLFGLLAVEMAVAAPRCVSVGLGVAFFLIGLYFVYRSFYGMRIEPKKVD